MCRGVVCVGCGCVGVVCLGVVCVGCGVCSVCRGCTHMSMCIHMSMLHLCALCVCVCVCVFVHAYAYGHVVRVYMCAHVQCEKFEDEYNCCVGGANGVYMLWTYTTVTAILFTLLGWVYIDWFKLPYRNVDDVFFK